MRCPYCRHPDSRVVDSREQDEGQVIRRRRSCPECGRRFTTVEEATLAVIKRSGVTEPFSRAKVVSGVRRACQGRPVDEDALAQLAQTVEEAIRATGVAEVPSDDVGLAILGPLRELDEVAYLRFASVYQAFSSVDDFAKAIEELRTDRRPPPNRRTPEPLPPAGRVAVPHPPHPPPATPSRKDLAHDRARHPLRRRGSDRRRRHDRRRDAAPSRSRRAAPSTRPAA